MERVAVSSSNLLSVGYDPASTVLEVAFKNGSVYQYRGVPERVYRGLLEASSKGTYLDRVVKKGGYSYVRVT